MKCVKEAGRKKTAKQVLRVADDEAMALVAGGEWVFCAKNFWKKKVR